MQADSRLSRTEEFPISRYRTIVRLSGSFVCGETFERERVRDLWRVQGEDPKGVREIYGDL